MFEALLSGRGLALVWCVVTAAIGFSCARSSAQVEDPAPGVKESAPASEGAIADAQRGIVHIRKESEPYVVVEPVVATKTDSALSVPAHVEFGDGAVSQIGAPLEGRILHVHIVVGQKVHVGDPLLTLDCSEASATRAAAQVAEASLREANLELERQQRMQKEGVGIERDLVTAQTKVAAAEAERRRADAVNASIGGGSGGIVVVHAPIDGVITARKATVGMSVDKTGEPLLEIGNTSALRIVADVFERDLPGIPAGAHAMFTFSTSRETLHGHVVGQGAVVGTGLRTAPVFLSIDERTTPLRPGMYGRASIELADGAMTLPVTAVLIADGKDPFVYVQRDEHTFERRSVQVAQVVDGRVQVLSGLHQGDKVVVKGALLLDGAADQLL